MTDHPASAGRQGSQGFALVLAILALLLLTFLGLTLATTSTTELQIATNYKWGQEARANAEAGIEVGKRVLRDMDWRLILPRARTGNWTPGAAPSPAAPPYTGATRNNENQGCDREGNAGYGVVLSNGVDRYENVSRIPTFPATVSGVSTALHGGFTLWIRRPLVRNNDGTFKDWSDDDTTLILTSEGTAPFVQMTGAAAQFTSANRAVYVMEVRLSQFVLPPCGTRGGQSGGSQYGAGFAACTTLGDDAVTREMQAAGATGTGAQTAGGVTR